MTHNPMQSPRRGLARRCLEGWRSFLRRDDGASAVEFALIAPVLISMIMGIIQFGSLFFLQNNMANVARETVRLLAVGTISTRTEAEYYVRDKLVHWGAEPTLSVTEPDPNDPNDLDYVVRISIPMSDATIVDPFGIFRNGSLEAEVTMRQE